MIRRCEISDRILVTYASRLGSTAGIAEAIGKLLTKNGALVDVLPMMEVMDLAQYQAVVIGSAIQNRCWLPEAVDFVRNNQKALSEKPSAMYSVCMTLAMKNGEKYRPDVLNWVSPVRAMVHPVGEGLFAGVLEIGKIPSLADRLKFRLSVFFGVWSEGDHRDWGAIHEWADNLYPKLIA